MPEAEGNDSTEQGERMQPPATMNNGEPVRLREEGDVLIAAQGVAGQENATERQIQAIVDKYLSHIPVADRVIPDEDAAKVLMYLVFETEDRSGGVFSRRDMLGNFGAFNAIGMDDAQKLAQALRQSAREISEGATTPRKLDYICESSIPQSVRNAVISIVLKEGDHSFLETIVSIADDLEKSEWPQENAGSSIHTLIQGYMKRDDAQAADDGVRAAAVGRMIHELYPQIESSNGMKLLRESSEINRQLLPLFGENELRFTKETIVPFRQKVEETTHDDPDAKKWFSRIKENSQASDILQILSNAIEIIAAKEIIKP